MVIPQVPEGSMALRSSGILVKQDADMVPRLFFYTPRATRFPPRRLSLGRGLIASRVQQQGVNLSSYSRKLVCALLRVVITRSFTHSFTSYSGRKISNTYARYLSASGNWSIVLLLYVAGSVVHGRYGVKDYEAWGVGAVRSVLPVRHRVCRVIQQGYLGCFAALRHTIDVQTEQTAGRCMGRYLQSGCY
jgi:hypothetical protein